MGPDRAGRHLDDDHEALADLVATYALDAIEHDDVAGVRTHLARCGDCRRDLRRHHEILTLLSPAPPAAPPRSVWQAIVRRTGTASTVGSDRGTRRTSARSPRPQRWTTAVVALAAAVVIATGLFGTTALQEHRRADQLTRELAAPPVARAAAQARRDGQHRDVPLTSADGAIHARVVVADDGAGYVVPEMLPPLPAGRAYQLWGITGADAGTRPVSLGVLGRQPGISAFHASAAPTTFALTEEPAGGSQGPTTPVLAATTLR